MSLSGYTNMLQSLANLNTHLRPGVFTMYNKSKLDMGNDENANVL